MTSQHDPEHRAGAITRPKGGEMNRMLEISPRIKIPREEIEIIGIRASGAGGQNVNKVSSAAHLRFDIQESSLPEPLKRRMLRSNDRRINKDGVVIIKAQRFRSQEKNRQDALSRLEQLIRKTCIRRQSRIATEPSRSSVQRRLDSKARRGQLKRLRTKPDWHDL